MKSVKVAENLSAGGAALRGLPHIHPGEQYEYGTPWIIAHGFLPAPELLPIDLHRIISEAWNPPTRRR
jgi:hypothetical protein